MMKFRDICIGMMKLVIWERSPKLMMSMYLQPYFSENRKKYGAYFLKNPRQAIALHQLVDPEFDLNIILGPAGSGKTFLAVAAGLHQVIETKQYKKIVVVRSRDFMDDDPGFFTR